MYTELAKKLMNSKTVDDTKFLESLLTTLVYYYRESKKPTDSDYWEAKYKAYISVLEDFIGFTIYDFSVDGNKIHFEASQIIKFDS